MVVRDFKENPITVEEQLHCIWYAVQNDLIGGWDISNVNKPESERNPYAGEFEMGTFMSQEIAEHIAEQHNEWWHRVVWSSYWPNIVASNIADSYGRTLDRLTEDN